MTRTVPVLLLLLAASPEAPPTASSPAPGLVTLALPGGEAVPLLDLSRPATKDGSGDPLNVVYWAGRDPAALASALNRDREHARVLRVFEAFRAWCVTNAVYDVAVSAVAGRPGERGRVLTVRWTRTGPQSWGKGEPAVREIALPHFPVSAQPGARDAALETTTRECALSFVAKLDGKRFEDAWNSASTLLRASTPREAFERAFQFAATVYGPVASRELVAWMYPGSSTAPGEGALVTVRFVIHTDGGEGVEDVTLRFDADKVWRVASYQPKARVPDERRRLMLPQTEGLRPGEYTFSAPAGSQ